MITATKTLRYRISPFLCAFALTLLALPARAQESPSQPAQPQPSTPSTRTPTPTGATKSVPVPTKSANSTDSVSEKPNSRAFHSPQAAAAALYAAACKNETTDLLAILGPNAKDLIDWSKDPDSAPEAKQDRQLFVQKYDQMHRLVREPDDTIALYVGPENWPVPIPIVEYKGAWYFDTDLGKQEILYRQLGRNEVHALDVSRALIDAEKDYYSDTHNYTSKFISTEGLQDGLYWRSSEPDKNSPIGKYLAEAGVTDSTVNRRPYHGYYYRILLQSPVAPNGDQKTGTANANNITIVAFPAEYRTSGVMTFVMDENGQAYEKDLGPTSASSALQINSFHPDTTWQKVE